MGTRLSGKVLATSSKRPSSIRFSFESISMGGREVPLKTRVVDVDNSRERVAPDGTVVGLDELRKRPGKVELLLLLAAHAHPLVLASLEVTKLALREIERPEVSYPVGTDVGLAIEDFPKDIPNTAPDPEVLVSDGPLVQIFGELPDRAQAKHPPVPSDWVNLAFLGTQQSLDQAFHAAGWQTAEELSLRTEARTFFAVAENHAYQRAPVSILLIGGRKPDVVYQKQNNTFAKRHHIRIWSTDRTWQGQPVWIAAATHDIGIDFSKQARTFTHRVDSDVDLERSKVVSDLGVAGRISSVTLLIRPSVPAASQNATGDQIHTDGRLAVLTLQP